MSYPFLGDIINGLFGISWNVPIPTFGLFVAIALIAATFVASKKLVHKAIFSFAVLASLAACMQL